MKRHNFSIAARMNHVDNEAVFGMTEANRMFKALYPNVSDSTLRVRNVAIWSLQTSIAEQYIKTLSDTEKREFLARTTIPAEVYAMYPHETKTIASIDPSYAKFLSSKSSSRPTQVKYPVNLPPPTSSAKPQHPGVAYLDALVKVSGLIAATGIAYLIFELIHSCLK
jgi:hypothetical protein